MSREKKPIKLPTYYVGYVVGKIHKFFLKPKKK